MNVEVVSLLTDKEVLSFQTEKSENIVSAGYDRIAKFLGISRTSASQNYYVNVN